MRPLKLIPDMTQGPSGNKLSFIITAILTGRSGRGTSLRKEPESTPNIGCGAAGLMSRFDCEFKEVCEAALPHISNDRQVVIESTLSPHRRGLDLLCNLKGFLRSCQ